MTEASVKTDAAPDDTTEVAAEPGEARDGTDPEAAVPAGATRGRRRLRRPSRFTVLVAALGTAVIVLAVAGALLFQHVRAVDELAEQRAAVLDSARKVAVDLTSISAADAPQRITSLTNETTGGFRGKLSTYGAVIQAVMRLSHAGSRGTVNDVAIERIDESSASVLVAATAAVTSDQAQTPRSVSYRMLVQLQREGDRWLVSDVSFVA